MHNMPGETGRDEETITIYFVSKTGRDGWPREMPIACYCVSCASSVLPEPRPFVCSSCALRQISKAGVVHLQIEEVPQDYADFQCVNPVLLQLCRRCMVVKSTLAFTPYDLLQPSL